MAAKTVRPGDQICILYGCSVPVILRGVKEVEEELTEREEHEVLERSPAENEPTVEGDMAPQVTIQEVSRLERQILSREPSWDYGPVGVSSIDSPERDAEPDSKHSSYYTVVGECYIDGMMDGEAMELLSSGDVKSRMLELR